MTPYAVVIQKEYFVVQDARPLYHWPEQDKPLTKIEMMRQLIADNKLEAERQRLKQLEEEEEAKRREEEGEDEETVEDEEADGDGDENGNGEEGGNEAGDDKQANENAGDSGGGDGNIAAPVEAEGDQ
jgi:hypothetical protein